MAPRKKQKYSNDLREVVIKHFLNGDSEREIACKTLIPHSSVNYMYKIQINEKHWKYDWKRSKTKNNNSH